MPKKAKSPPTPEALRQQRRRALRAKANMPDPDLIARVTLKGVAFAMARGKALAATGIPESAQDFWRDVWQWCSIELVTGRGFPIEAVRAAMDEATSSRPDFAGHFSWRERRAAGTEAAQISENSEASR